MTLVADLARPVQRRVRQGAIGCEHRATDTPAKKSLRPLLPLLQQCFQIVSVVVLS